MSAASLLTTPPAEWTCVMTSESRPQQVESALPRVLIEGALVPAESFLNRKLIAQLELWQHDAQYSRWCRLLRHFQLIGTPFRVLVRKQRFDLHSNHGCFVYRARRNWLPLDEASPLLDWLGAEAQRALQSCREARCRYSLWYKRHRVHLFLEDVGESFFGARHMRARR